MWVPTSLILGGRASPRQEQPGPTGHVHTGPGTEPRRRQRDGKGWRERGLTEQAWGLATATGERAVWASDPEQPASGQQPGCREGGRWRASPAVMRG